MDKRGTQSVSVAMKKVTGKAQDAPRVPDGRCGGWDAMHRGEHGQLITA
ncbi:MAG: hypothetical protein QHJ34_01300 [bacterium]|nr:hypothetical protein [bacterium]